MRRFWRGPVWTELQLGAQRDTRLQARCYYRSTLVEERGKQEQRRVAGNRALRERVAVLSFYLQSRNVSLILKIV